MKVIALVLMLMSAATIAGRVWRDRTRFARVFAVARQRPRVLAAILAADLVVVLVGITSTFTSVANMVSTVVGAMIIALIGICLSVGRDAWRDG